ncbi:MAG: hypothetical protein P1V97_22410 [Planctomycetota bacterium]|nr:hypothetical protein [Planctomycetota bacterium]
MFALIILLLLVPVLLGFLVIQSLYPQLNRAFKWALAPGIGVGLSSSLFFVSLMIFGEAGPLCLTLELGVMATAAVVIVRRAKEETPGLPEFQKISWSKLHIILALLFLTLFVLTFTSSVYQGLSYPHGTFDAHAIWNVRGKVLALSGEKWPESFSRGLLFHPDYPLLIPGANARIWGIIGEQPPYVPLLNSSLFYLSLLGVFVLCVTALRGFGTGMMAGILFCGSPVIVEVALEQLADVPLACFMLSTLVLFTLQDKTPDHSRLSLLAGVTAGLAAWTKNEGILFIAVVAFVRLCVLWKRSGFATVVKQGSRFFLGCLPFLILLIVFKLQYAPPNDIVSGQSSSTLEKITDPDRYLMIFTVLGRRIVYFGGGQVGVLLILFGCVVIFGGSKDWNKSTILSAVGIIGLMALGYFIVYLTTPRDLDWHLKWSIRRLMLQLWPCLQLVCFLWMKSVAEVEESVLSSFEKTEGSASEEELN